MRRLTAALAGGWVTIIVFATLAASILQTLFGLQALLVMYSCIAVAAGATTYILSRRIGSTLAKQADSQHLPASADETSDRAKVDVSLDDELVETEIQQLRDE